MYWCGNADLGDDMSRKKAGPQVTLNPRAGTSVRQQALPMITFISNRLVAGVAASVRDFADLSVNEARIVLLINAGGVDTAAEAMRLIGIDQAAISRSIRRLIERGFVVSTPDKQHAKRNILSLTAEGGRYAVALGLLNEKREDRLLSVLTDAERAFFLDILGRVLGNVEAANAVRPQPDWLPD